MKMYLLVDNETGKTVNIYKYAYVALSAKERTGVAGAVKSMWGCDKNDRYRVEVMEVIE